MIPEKLHKYFLPYELALRMKNIGFSEPCFDYFANGNPQNALDISYNSDDLIRDFESVARPTFSQAFSWFREKYNIHSWIIPLVDVNGFVYDYQARFHQEESDVEIIDEFDKIEKAELACLDKLLEIVEQKQK